jgi:hypothetical protein
VPPSAERERERFHAGIEKLDLELSIGDRSRLSNQLLEAGVAVDMSSPLLSHGDPYHFLSNRLMVGIDRLDKDLVQPRCEATDNNGIAAGVRPVPCRVIDRHVDLSNPGSHSERRRAKDRQNVQVLGTILMNTTPRDSASATGASTMIFTGGPFGAVPAGADATLGALGTVNITAPSSSCWWFAVSSSSRIVCGPGGRPLRTTGSPLASAQSLGHRTAAVVLAAANLTVASHLN